MKHAAQQTAYAITMFCFVIAATTAVGLIGFYLTEAWISHTLSR